MNISTINLPDHFLEEEIRDDYHISVKNKKIMAVELDLANKLLETCRKHGIKIVALAGTLLGAIRHKGFIPWDDDMDFAMLYEDFLKLEAIADEFQYPYFLQTAKTDKKYFCGYARLRNSETTGKIFWHNSNEYNNGIYIDIYIMNGVPDDPLVYKRMLKKKDVLEKILNTYNSDWDRGAIKNALTKAFRGTISKLISYDKMIDYYRRFLSRYDNTSKKVTVIAQHNTGIIYKMAEKSFFDEIIDVPYENITVPVFAKYDDYLKTTYGNYMEFPPIDQRGVWHDGTIEFDPDIPYKEYVNRT